MSRNGFTSVINQTLQKGARDLCLHCLLVSQFGVSPIKLVKFLYIFYEVNIRGFFLVFFFSVSIFTFIINNL